MNQYGVWTVERLLLIICLLPCSVWLEVREGGVTRCQGGSLRDWLPAEQNAEIILRDCYTSPLYCHIINAKLSFLPANSWEHLGWTPLPQSRNDEVIFQCERRPPARVLSVWQMLPIILWLCSRHVAQVTEGLHPTITGTPRSKIVLSPTIYFYCRIATLVSQTKEI